nr:hypothetical protein GCM10020185_11950 [Pseudomonas brassicacearum subsp. brassicacearum]
MLTTGALGGYYAITSWLPTFLKNERGLSVLSTGGYLAMVIVGSYVGYVVSAYLSDILGRKKRTSSCMPSALSPSCCCIPNCT